MAPTAYWLCFAPRQFARGRDYEVLCAVALPPQLASAFAILAEGVLRTATVSAPTASTPVWLFAALAPDGPAVLARCAFEERDGARARVIWALALPQEYVRSHHFALHVYVERFAQLPGAGSIPASFELDEPRATPFTPEVTLLLAKYIEAGAVRVALDIQRALRVFCQTVELLPPSDRLKISFSTVASDARTFEADAAAASLEALVVGEDARTVAHLWSIFRYGVAAPLQAELSLTRNPVDWLCSLLNADDLPSRFRGLTKLVMERLEPAQHGTAFALLRRALELQLLRSGGKAAAATLIQLEAEGYLGSDYGTPPIWLTRLVIELSLLPRLSAELLQKILQPSSLGFLVSSLQRGTSAKRLQAWVAGLQRTPAHDAAGRRELMLACGTAWRDLVSAGGRRFTHADLARSVALLTLYEHCRGKMSVKRRGGLQ